MQFPEYVCAGKLRPAAIAAIALGLSLGGCASVPDLGQAPAVKAAAAFESAAALQGDQGRWPVDDWWNAYGDSQLSGLIGEALAGAPDMAAAQARLAKAESFTEQAQARRQARFDLNGQLAETKQSYNNGVPRAAVPRG